LDSKRAQLFEIFEFAISYLFNTMTPIFHLSNQQNLLLTMVQALYVREVFILSHYYGPPSTESRTTETTIVRCHKKQLNLFNKYLLRVTFETCHKGRLEPTNLDDNLQVRTYYRIRNCETEA